MTEQKRIVYFDGVCNLCNWAVQFIIHRDKQKKFSFASLQSNYAKMHLTHGNGQDIKFDSVILQDEGAIKVRSEAALGIARQLDGPWRFLAVMKVIPVSWRDWLYNVVSTNRYRWFGRRDECMIPNPELQSRFLS